MFGGAVFKSTQASSAESLSMSSTTRGVNLQLSVGIGPVDVGGGLGITSTTSLYSTTGSTSYVSYWLKNDNSGSAWVCPQAGKDRLAAVANTNLGDITGASPTDGDFVANLQGN